MLKPLILFSTFALTGILAGMAHEGHGKDCHRCSRCDSELSLSDYVLDWEDDFNGSALDREVWNVEVNGTGCGNNELQYYVDSPENVSVAGGNLILTARRADYNGTHSFTSGRVNTRGKKTFTYGLIEARIKLPKTADGLWPAFWMMGDDIVENGWPLCGEIDILEMGHANGIAAGVQERLFNGAIHYGRDTQAHRQQVGDRTNAYSLQDGEYHNFYLSWTPERLDMYVDTLSDPYLSVDISERNNMESAGAYFHKPGFILFNLAVGGNFPEIHTPEGVTALGPDGKASMLVDYVRVYRRAGQSLAAE